MNRLFAVLILLALIVIGVGFYRGWFALSKSNTEAGTNKVDVQLTVDKDKVQEDVDAVAKSATDLTESVTGGEAKTDEPANAEHDDATTAQP
jgi:hypothetical protein